MVRDDEDSPLSHDGGFVVNQHFPATAGALQHMRIEAHHIVQLLPKPEVSEALVAARVVVVVERAHIAKHPACPAQ